MTTTTTMTDKKIMAATVKSFIRRNRSELLVRVKRDHAASDFAPAECREKMHCRKTCRYIPATAASADDPQSLGIKGVWFTQNTVGHDSGNRCRRIKTETVRGYEVSNGCGTWSVAVRQAR